MSPVEALDVTKMSVLLAALGSCSTELDVSVREVPEEVEGTVDSVIDTVPSDDSEVSIGSGVCWGSFLDELVMPLELEE